MVNRRVVVTGIGAVTPLGLTAQESWENVKKGVCGIGPVTLFDAEPYRAKLAGEVKGFAPENYMDRKEARRMDRFCQLAMAAAVQAMEDSGLDLEAIDRTRFATHIGCGVGGLGTTERESVNLDHGGPGKVAPLLVPMIIVDMAPGLIAMRYGLKGTCTSVVTACASGTNAVGDAFRMIKHGYADYCLTGGAEAAVTTLSFAGFTKIQALTERTDPMRASIPFDKERDGFVMGEGAGILILEERESALKRGAKIYGEIVGYGSTCDAYHMTAPDPDGAGAAAAMRQALHEAGIQPKQVGYINAHGTSTPPNDRVETIAIKAVFPEGGIPPISSTKSMTGHLLGATGAVEAIFSLQAMADSFLPPTIGFQVPDPECDLDIVPNEGRSAQIEYALSNSMGFGGHNAALLMRKEGGA